VIRHSILVLTLAMPLFGGSSVLAEDGKKASKEPITFGALRSVSADEARTQAQAWLQSIGKSDPAAIKSFNAIWSHDDRSVMDRVAETLTQFDPAAAALIKEGRDPASPPPQALPALLKDSKRSAFYRANLALAYARALSRRKVYEESLDVLKQIKVEDVVDPSSYLFHRAVAEHALTLKDDATRSIVRLLDDVTEVPDRYKMVAVLMAFDMSGWQDKDLGAIARKMDNVERRLELSRGGPKTQKIQKEVVARLDEIIKALENECKGNCNGGCCPNGGRPGFNVRPSSPMQDSQIGRGSGAGKVDPKQLEHIAQQWGKLPEKERAEAMQNLTRDMPAKYRDVIENYFKKLATSSEANKP
jgi:hypothetical protein